MFKIALDAFEKHWREAINLKTVKVRSTADMVEALNAFDGMLAVFDGHGSHQPDHPGVLWLGDEPLDVWNLRGQVRNVPPIVILSACDTHASDPESRNCSERISGARLPIGSRLGVPARRGACSDVHGSPAVSGGGIRPFGRTCPQALANMAGGGVRDASGSRRPPIYCGI